VGYDESFDTVLFNRNFREFYDQLNGALIQNDNWRQLSQTFDRPAPAGAGQTYEGQFFDQENYAYSYPPNQRYYQNQPAPPQSYNFIPPDPWEQNIYVQSDPRSRNRNSRTYREYQQPNPPTTYQQAPQRSGVLGPNQGSNTLVPVIIPRGGDQRTNSVVEQNPAGGVVVPQSTTPAIPQDGFVPEDSLSPIPTDSLLTAFPTDSLWSTKIDTLFLDKEIIIGLPNSKKEVYFGINQKQLEEEEKQKLEAIVAILEAQPTFYVTLAGFADNTGDISYNLQLIVKRVNHVKSLFVDQYGLDEDRISVKPGGLLIRDKNRASRNEDRKVEIIIYDPGLNK
jgi:outer membrane protein OmpA-like peptidoglycan-associated protein